MKKNNRQSSFFKTPILLLSISAFSLLASCSSNGTSGSDPNPDPGPDPIAADTLDAIAPDGMLETVTWNIEWYGSVTNGPSNEDLQTGNVIEVIDSLEADLYAFEEISSQNDLNEITGFMRDYKGFVADHIDYNQKTAFVFNTQTIDSISSGAITELQDENDWAGRLPFYFQFNYSYNDITTEIYAVVIHGKCCTDDESYNRRKRAAASLYEYLMENKPDANIVILGDYNDDVDVSIADEMESPYQPFVENSDNFVVISKSLSDEGVSSTVGYPDMVDHITISNEMETYYEMGSIMRLKPTSNFIESYGSTTSDHYPVFAEFDITK